MYYCQAHNWSSLEAQCLYCFPITIVTTSTESLSPKQGEEIEVKGRLIKAMFDWHDRFYKEKKFNIPLDHEQSEYLIWLASELTKVFPELSPTPHPDTVEQAAKENFPFHIIAGLNRKEAEIIFNRIWGAFIAGSKWQQEQGGEVKELHERSAELSSLKQSILESKLKEYFPKRDMSLHDKMVFAIDLATQSPPLSAIGQEEILTWLYENNYQHSYKDGFHFYKIHEELPKGERLKYYTISELIESYLITKKG